MIKHDDEGVRQEAKRIIHTGGVIAFRTDTFYGLGVDPFNPDAIRKIRELKGREEAKPILLLISDFGEAERFVALSESYKMIAIGQWPAPLTLIGVARLEVPAELTAGTNSIGLRMPGNVNVRAIVRACGGALTATSANLSGSAPARSAQEVQHYFPDAIDLIIDGGEVNVDLPSTVVDLTGEKPRMVREGAVGREELRDILGE